MENHQITAAKISASSQVNGNFSPHHGRLHYKGIGGAWAAGATDVPQWIQIDLRVEANVTFLATQGRYWDPDQRVTQYKIQHSKDGLSFQVYNQAGDNSPKVRVGWVPEKCFRQPLFKNQIVTFYTLFGKKSRNKRHS